MAKNRPKEKNKAPNNTGEILVGDFATWRALASQLNPDLAKKAKENPDDDWKLNELATALRESSGLIANHWTHIQRIANKTEDKSVSFGLSFNLNRSNTPTEVDAKISYAEKYAENIQTKVPDPAQGDLPLTSDPAQP